MTKLLIPEDDNLVTYFVLPLVGASINTFGKVAYKTAYINKNGTEVYVELRKPMISRTYAASYNYKNTVVIFGVTFIVYDIPPQYYPDIELFKKGLYSKMSKETKRKIYAGSGLPYNQTMEDFTVTHPILHCLASTKRMQTFLIAYLDVRQLADSGEFIDPPDETWFVENRIKQLKTENQCIT